VWTVNYPEQYIGDGYVPPYTDNEDLDLPMLMEGIAYYKEQTRLKKLKEMSTVQV
jgi:hypothetical protein